MMIVNPWIVAPGGRRGTCPAIRLICFPYAGGAASIFRTWPHALPVEIELWAIEPPGHGTRLREPPFDQLGPLITSLTDVVAPQLDAPFAIYGHSLGALLGFSFARELRQRGHAKPVHLFVSGRRAPQLLEPTPLHELPERQFLDQLYLLGGIPDAVFRDTELMAMFSPTLRADVAINETWRTPAEPPLACPITALGGLTDKQARPDELDAWRVETSASFHREMFPGGHFFLQSARTAVLASLRKALEHAIAASRSIARSGT